MSTRERPRDEKSKKKDETVDDWLDNYDSKTKDGKQNTQQSVPVNDIDKKVETQSPEVRTEQDVSEVLSDVEQFLAEFSRKLPGWVGKPWMYVKPTHDGHFKNWIESWKKLILDYSETLTIHIVSIYDLQSIHPFTNKNINKDLSIGELQLIVAQMVDENLAKWLDGENSRARIYFKTDDEWASEMYGFMLEHGYATEILTLYEMKNLEQDWSSLPDSEIGVVLDILIAQNKAEWIGSDRDTIQFKL